MVQCITIKQIIAFAFTFVLCAFWSTIMTLKMIYDVFCNGWDAFSYRKARTQPPEVLIKGWNHDFVILSNVTLHYVHSGSRDKPLMLFLHGFPEFWYSWRHQMREFENYYSTKYSALETPLAAISAEFCRDATVKYIEGASHWVQQDEPALCSSYMRKFLKDD